MVAWTTELLGLGLTVHADAPALATRARAILPPAPVASVGRLMVTLDRTLAGPVRLVPGLHRWLTWSGGARGVVDCTRWNGRVRVGAHLLADVATLRHQVLEPAALFRITACDRVPLHAAALSRHGRAVLLAGPAGVGKSTLTWLAARAGFAVLAEDIVYARQRPSLLLHGRGRHVHLRPEVAERVGATEIVGRVVRASGVPKVAVPVAPSPTGTAAPAGVVWLTPGPRSGLAPAAAADAVRALVHPLPEGFTRFASETAALAPRLVAAGAWRLTVNHRPETAAALLLDLIDHLLPECEVP